MPGYAPGNVIAI